MKKSYINILLVPCFFIGCVQKIKKEEPVNPKKYTITGILKNVEDLTWVYLDNPETGKDSTRLVNKTFQFRGSIREPEEVYIYTEHNKTNGLRFFLENLDINITATGHLKNAKIKAGKMQSEIDSLLSKNKPLEIEIERLDKEIKKHRPEPEEVRDVFKRKKKKQIDSIETNIKNFIKQHPDSYVSINLLSKNFTRFTKDTLGYLFRDLSDSIKSSKQGRHIERILTLPDAPLVEEHFIDFSLPDTNNEKLKISNLLETFTVLIFWDSSDANCKKETNKLKRRYAEYKSYGLEVIGISWDKDEEKWLKTIQKDSLPWIQLRDHEGAHSDISLTYRIKQVPYTLLLNREGIINAKNFKGWRLSRRLSTLFPKSDEQ